ncbi:haloacid dehalogenase, type II [Aspergillus californicus]
MARPGTPVMLFFDVLGTVVEWRFCIANQLKAAAQRALQDDGRDISADIRGRVSDLSAATWDEITDEWHRSYMNFGRTYDPCKRFVPVDEHNRTSLGTIFTNRRLRDIFNDDDLQHLTLGWHRLDPYSDSMHGLLLLNTKFPTSTLSNGNVKLLQDLQEHGSLPFTHLTSAEHFNAYKPAPEVYHAAARRFGLDTSQCCLVAAHLHDLQAAKNCGFQTIYIERPLEEAWDSERVAQAKEEGFVDHWIDVEGSGLLDVARYFGIETDA